MAYGVHHSPLVVQHTLVMGNERAIGIPKTRASRTHCNLSICEAVSRVRVARWIPRRRLAPEKKPNVARLREKPSHCDGDDSPVTRAAWKTPCSLRSRVISPPRQWDPTTMYARGALYSDHVQRPNRPRNWPFSLVISCAPAGPRHYFSLCATCDLVYLS